MAALLIDSHRHSVLIYAPSPQLPATPGSFRVPVYITASSSCCCCCYSHWQVINGQAGLAAPQRQRGNLVQVTQQALVTQWCVIPACAFSSCTPPALVKQPACIQQGWSPACRPQALHIGLINTPVQQHTSLYHLTPAPRPSTTSPTHEA
jgi:hypothetical protein